jgi:G:T-mismatch repair DNA endonuclease (very short patch repair protein)
VEDIQGTGGRVIDTTRQKRSRYRFQEVPHLEVDGYFEETRTVYEFNRCYWHGCPTCQTLRDVPIVTEDILAEQYERNMDRLVFITRAGYKVDIQWECEYDRDILKDRPELQTLPIVE